MTGACAPCCISARGSPVRCCFHSWIYLLPGLGNISWELLSSQTSYINDTIGILPNFLNTLYIILLAMVIVLPLG